MIEQQAPRALLAMVLEIFLYARSQTAYLVPHLAGQLSLLKFRDGALGYVDLYFTAATLRFEDVLDPGI